MMTYVDSSVVLRFVLEQPGTLVEVEAIPDRVTSHLTLVECLRTIDNARLRNDIAEAEYLARRQAVYGKLRGMGRISPTRSILLRAGLGFPVPLKTLDAIHLATAMQLRDRRDDELVFATHDQRLGRAAAALDFDVIGC
jgi:predicted nucleic acid-binding protein